MAIFIVLHHISERISSGFAFSFLVHLGYLLVAFFFFLSGFGLISGYIKKENYLKGFWINRVGYIIAVYLFFVVLYITKNFIVGTQESLGAMLKSVVSLSPVVDNSWYILVIILYYIFFYISFKIFKNSIAKGIVLVFILQALFAVAFFAHNLPNIWYISGFSFFIGLVWGFKKDEIDSFVNKYYIISFITVLGGFTLFSALPVVFERAGVVIPLIRIASRCISSVFAAITLVVISKKIKLFTEIWGKLGVISLEIYLIQGMVYGFLRSNIVYIESDTLWAALTVLITVILAAAIQKVTVLIKASLNKLSNKFSCKNQ